MRHTPTDDPMSARPISAVASGKKARPPSVEAATMSVGVAPVGPTCRNVTDHGYRPEPWPPEG